MFPKGKWSNSTSQLSSTELQQWKCSWNSVPISLPDAALTPCSFLWPVLAVSSSTSLCGQKHLNSLSNILFQTQPSLCVQNPCPLPAGSLLFYELKPGNCIMSASGFFCTDSSEERVCDHLCSPCSCSRRALGLGKSALDLTGLGKLGFLCLSLFLCFVPEHGNQLFYLEETGFSNILSYFSSS